MYLTNASISALFRRIELFAALSGLFFAHNSLKINCFHHWDGLYLVPGNHDCDAQTWKFDAFNAVFDSPDVLTVQEASSSLRIALANVFTGDTEADESGKWTDAHDLALRDANEAALADRVPLILCLHTWLLPDAPPPPNEEGRGCIKDSARALATVSECASVVAVFSGHRHINRITAYRDFLIVDTACLIGYPFGFREVSLSDDGWFSTRFHRLKLPEVMAAYRARDDAGEDTHWEGQPHHMDCDLLIPRLRELRR